MRQLESQTKNLQTKAEKIRECHWQKITPYLYGGHVNSAVPTKPLLEMRYGQNVGKTPTKFSKLGPKYTAEGSGSTRQAFQNTVLKFGGTPDLNFEPTLPLPLTLILIHATPSLPTFLPNPILLRNRFFF